MNERKLTISFLPDFKNVDMARAAINGICRESFRMPGSESMAGDVCLAVTEAMNNAVEHSGSDMVVIELKVTATEMVFRMFTDGDEFDTTREASMPTFDDADDLPEGGFGRAIMLELMDHVSHEYRDNNNILTLKKIFADKREE